MKRLVIIAVIATCFLTACAESKDSPGDETSPSQNQSEATSPTPTPSANLVPEAITSFSCQATSQDQWIAGGEITNPEDVSNSYRVTVFLGSGEGTGHSQEVGPIAPKESKEFSFGVLTPADPQASCRIQAEKLEK